MPSKDEHAYIRSIHKLLPVTKGDLLIWKIADRYTGGIPDVYYSGTRAPLWVEYKYIPKLPKRDGTRMPVSVSPIQQLHLTAEQARGVNVALIIGCEDYNVIVTDDFMDFEIFTEQFKILSRSKREVAEWITKQTMKQISA